MPRNDKRRGRPPEPIDPNRVIARLTLSAGKAAEICGISRRQLCYWTDKGIIQAVSEDGAEQTQPSRRMYDFPALCRALLIKHEIDRGSSLQHAVREVDRRLRAHVDRQHELLEAPAREREQFLVAQAERMIAIAAHLREAVQARPGGRWLRALAHALLRGDRAIAESGTTDLLEDPKACCRLRAALDQIQDLCEQMDRESRT